jgi:GNAT superfamily N-acetyltransferase
MADVIELRPATLADAQRIATIWTQALVDEPMAQWPLDCGQREAATAADFAVLASGYAGLGSIWVDTEIRGAAAWLSPEGAAQFEVVLELSQEAIVPLTDDAGARYSSFWTWIAERMPAEPMWFLDILAVHPDSQGSGVGSALVRRGLELAQRDGVPAILETGNPRNVEYYRNFGFEVVHAEAAPDGGPMVWFMVCQPH